MVSLEDICERFVAWCRDRPAEYFENDKEKHTVVKIGGIRKGTNGVSTNGVTANFMFFDGGTFWVIPLTCLYLPNIARAYLFPESVKSHNCSSVPTSVDPFVCNQTKRKGSVSRLI